MKTLIKHWFITLYYIIVFALAVIFPSFEITLTGGFAWANAAFIWALAVVFVYSGITGAEVSYQSNGLIPLVKKMFKRNRNKIAEDELK